MLAETDELELFETRPVTEIIEYSWTAFAYKFHILGFSMHMFYMWTLCVYIQEVYCIAHIEVENHLIIYKCMLSVGILYPLIYDNIQMYKIGLIEYFSDIWNYTDLIFIWSGFLNIAI